MLSNPLMRLKQKERKVRLSNHFYEIMTKKIENLGYQNPWMGL